MDPLISEDCTNSTVVWTNSMKRSFTVKPVPKSDDKNRRATDIFWGWFFFLVLIGWLLSWRYAIAHHKSNYNVQIGKISDVSSELIFHPSDFDVLPSGIDIKNVPHLEIPETNDDIISENDMTVENTTKPIKKNCRDRFKRRRRLDLTNLIYSFIETFTLNPSRLGVHENGTDQTAFYILINLFFFTATSMSFKELSFVGIPFSFLALIEHLSLKFHSNNSITSPVVPYHEKLVYWVIPELFFLIIWFSNVMSDSSSKNHNDSLEDNLQDNNSQVSNDESEDDSDADSEDDNYGILEKRFNDTIPFHNFVYSIVFGFPFIIVLKLLVIATISMLYKIGWVNPYSYIIAGGSCYIGLTIYYFGLMLTACATNILMDNDNLTFKDLQRALFIVSRYHFGTACYHATLIFPRLHATWVMNEPEFRILERYPSICRRFKVTHFEVYNIAPTLTAARGHSHADSIRELLRLYSDRIFSKPLYFQHEGFSRYLSILMKLLAFNNLMLILLWFYGANDPKFSHATWVMYIRLMITFKVLMPFFNIVGETIGLRMCGRKVNIRGPLGEVLSTIKVSL